MCLQERIWHEVEGAQGAAAALLYRSYTRRSAKLRFRAVWKHWQMLWYSAHATREAEATAQASDTAMAVARAEAGRKAAAYEQALAERGAELRRAEQHVHSLQRGRCPLCDGQAGGGAPPAVVTRLASARA